MNEQTWIGFKSFFVDKYQSLKITQKLRAGQTGYYSMYTVVPAGGIASALDRLEMAATTDQIHVGQMMATIHQLTETNKIRGDQIKQLSETNVILDRQGQEDKKTTNKN